MRRRERMSSVPRSPISRVVSGEKRSRAAASSTAMRAFWRRADLR